MLYRVFAYICTKWIVQTNWCLLSDHHVSSYFLFCVFVLNFFSLSLPLSFCQSCLSEELSDDSFSIVQLNSACRAGYIISCNIVTSHTWCQIILCYSLQGQLSNSQKYSQSVKREQKGHQERSSGLAVVPCYKPICCSRMAGWADNSVEVLRWAVAAQVNSVKSSVIRRMGNVHQVHFDSGSSQGFCYTWKCIGLVCWSNSLH